MLVEITVSKFNAGFTCKSYTQWLQAISGRNASGTDACRPRQFVTMTFTATD